MMRDDQVRRLVLSGVLAAIIIVLTVLISIPMPGGHGYINLGDAGVLTAAFVLGGPWGALCGGAASAIADLLLGWGVYAPASFLIKGGMAFLAALLMKRGGGKARLWTLYPAALLVPAGYLLFESVLYGTAAALPNVPLNLVQCLVGAGAAHAIVAVLARGAAVHPGKTVTTEQTETPAPCTEAQPETVREPKGGPDVVLIGYADQIETLKKAGDHLSVRGLTARIVRLPEGASLATLSQAQRQGIVPDGVPYICTAENSALDGASAADVAKTALEAIQA